MRTVKIIFTLVLMLTLGGCYDYKETGDIAIVTGMLLKKGENGEKYNTIIEIADVQSGESTSPVSKAVSREGDTITEAVEKSTAAAGRKLYFGHMQVLMIDRELAEDGINDAIDYFIRHNDIRLSMQVMITEKAGEELFEGNGDKPKAVVSFENAELLKSAAEKCVAPAVELYKFKSLLMERGMDAYLPVVSFENPEDPKSVGTAVFKGGKLEGVIDEKDTRNFLLMSGDGSTGGTVTVKDGNDTVAFEIKDRACSIKPQYKNGRLTVKVKFTGKYSLTERENKKEDFSDKDAEKLLTAHMEKELKETLERLSAEYKNDVLGIMQKVTAGYSETADLKDADLDRIYQGAEFEVKAESAVIDNGREMKS